MDVTMGRLSPTSASIHLVKTFVMIIGIGLASLSLLSATCLSKEKLHTGTISVNASAQRKFVIGSCVTVSVTDSRCKVEEGFICTTHSSSTLDRKNLLEARNAFETQLMETSEKMKRLQAKLDEHTETHGAFKLQLMETDQEITRLEAHSAREIQLMEIKRKNNKASADAARAARGSRRSRNTVDGIIRRNKRLQAKLDNKRWEHNVSSSSELGDSRQEHTELREKINAGKPLPMTKLAPKDHPCAHQGKCRQVIHIYRGGVGPEGTGQQY